MISKQYDIFISYRREGGEDKARIINQHLSSYGYHVFFDHEAGIRKEFETVILAAVETSPVFLMLLTPYCFDECIDKEDWVRREVELAFKCHKEVIPIRPNYDFEFKNLPEGMPNCIEQLSRQQFAEIDFHHNFKATVNHMIEERIKPIVQPSIINATSNENGAIIHFFSDISCRVMHFGKQLIVTNAENQTEGTTARLLRGRHLLDYVSIEHEEDSYRDELTIPDNNYEDFVRISLQAIKDKRIEREEQLKIEQMRRVYEERKRRQKNQAEKPTTDNDQYQFDFFFCYSRKDAFIARMVFSVLEESGYKCFYDGHYLSAGEFFHDEISNAINQCRCFLFFYSENSSRSKWVKHELNYAISKKKTLLPILLNGSISDNPYIKAALKLNIWLDFSKMDNDWVELLLDTVRKIIR